MFIMEAIEYWRGKLHTTPVGENQAHIVNVLRVLMLAHMAVREGRDVVYKHYPVTNIVPQRHNG